MCIKMNQEFEDFFLHCHKVTNSNKAEIEKILKPLKVHLWRQQLKKYLKIVLFLTAICFATYHVDTLNWYFCAVGRIIMIKLLPLWNWKYLTKEKCLIPKAEPIKVNRIEPYINVGGKDCRACEKFGKLSNRMILKNLSQQKISFPEKVDVFKETRFKFINDKFLIRGLPVIVSDSETDFDRKQLLSQFLDNISKNMTKMIKANACNLETNLMLSEFATVDETISILYSMIGDTEVEADDPTPWFLSFRNCKFEAVKFVELL